MAVSNDILTKLAAPFHPSRIVWKPGALTGKKDKAMALAYADLRAYQSRLDEVCGMDWAVSYTPWGSKIICHITINGITRSSTGEADSQSERSEIDGTSAEAQAFKRACAMFGLGRYLYNLPSLWVEYDAPNQRFTDKAKIRLQGVIAQHYQRYLDGQPTELEGDADEGGDDAGTGGGTPAPVAATAQPQATNDALTPLRNKLDGLGRELYGEQWGHVRQHNAKRLGVAEEALTKEQIQTLISGLKKLKQQRQAA